MSARTRTGWLAAAIGAAGFVATIAVLPAHHDAATAAPAATTTSSTSPATGFGDRPIFDATVQRTYDAPTANQAVAVDANYFYAVDNRAITKYDRKTGKALLTFTADPAGPLIHMDSAAVVNGKLYVAHSNYNTTPEKSSIEVFDARTLQHLQSFSFGIYRGSLTWIDWHDGAWYAVFANYDQLGSDGKAYGGTDNTQVVKLDRNFQVVESWTIPQAILDRARVMSISGGSWGPDGRLWITGHDWGEAYVMELPKAGPDLTWVATVNLPTIEGQGIAWDRSDPRHPSLWAIKRSTRQVVRLDAPWKQIKEPTTSYFTVTKD